MSGAPNKPLGEYCTLGYFDAMSIKKINIEDGNAVKEIWKQKSQISVDAMDVNGTYRNQVCLPWLESADEAFEGYALEAPYLFVSLIRIDRRNKDTYDRINIMLDGRKKYFEKTDNLTEMFYYSYDHSELIMLKIGNSYREGMDAILSIKAYLEPIKINSYFSVREDKLEHISNLVQHENVDVRLHTIVKKSGDYESYVGELCVSLFPGDPKGRDKIKVYNLLGNSDLLIEIQNVRLDKLLTLYKMNNLLTHTNELYEKNFYNIETEIAIETK